MVTYTQKVLPAVKSGKRSRTENEKETWNKSDDSK